jgi:tRNA (guanine-N7-)-methyltransferase
VEIGVGTSTFLIEVAAQAPEFNYLGFEYSAKRVAKFLKKVAASGVTNIRMALEDATAVLGGVLAAGSVDRFFINHPDPWPKRRHAKKRFVNRRNMEILVRFLRPGGGLSLRTDHAAYAEQMIAVLDATDGLENLAGRGSFSPKPRETILTLYESKFLRAGQPIFYLEYSKAPAAPGAAGC